MENLKKIAKEILLKNRYAYLSGSLALNIMQFKTRRIPSDIDILMSYEEEFVKLDGMIEYDYSDDYNESEYKRIGYKYGEVKVDVFHPIDKDNVLRVEFYSNSLSDEDNPDLKIIRAVHYSDILKFKIEHSYDEDFSDKKHREDLIWFFQNNIR